MPCSSTVRACVDELATTRDRRTRAAAAQSFVQLMRGGVANHGAKALSTADDDFDFDHVAERDEEAEYFDHAPPSRRKAAAPRVQYDDWDDD